MLPLFFSEVLNYLAKLAGSELMMGSQQGSIVSVAHEYTFMLKF
jgi:hypothetical protein